MKKYSAIDIQNPPKKIIMENRANNNSGYKRWSYYTRIPAKGKRAINQVIDAEPKYNYS